MSVKLPRLSNAGSIVAPAGHASQYMTGYWNALCSAIEGALNSLDSQQSQITAAQSSAAAAHSSAAAAQSTANTALYSPPVAAGWTGTATTATTFAGNRLGYQYTSGGAANVTLADNTTGPPNRCNVFVAGAYGSGVAATVAFPGQLIKGLGLTPGATIWLGTAGAMLTAPPGSGFSQIIGDVDHDGNLFFNPQPIVGL